MSRVGKAKLTLPNTVTLEVNGLDVKMKGRTSAFDYKMPKGFECRVEGNVVSVTPVDPKNCNDALWGTTTRNIFHKIKGLDTPFEKTLNFVGVGFKAALQGKTLVMDLGYSHKIEYALPEGVDVKVVKPTQIVVSSACKQKLGQVCGEISRFRKTEPYKGKGIIEEGTFVFRKEGKKK